MRPYHIFTLSALLLFSCNSKMEKTKQRDSKDFHIAGAMKNVMWKGELDGVIYLDTLSENPNLYGVGPLEFLSGEITILNGQTYVSKVTSDTTMTVERTTEARAPFLVYATEQLGKKVELPDRVSDINTIEAFIDSIAAKRKEPFPFRIEAEIESAQIHVQNLPAGTKVSSPKEAHQGQTTYSLANRKVDIVGFFSRNHQGVFTHHDTFLHMHLITEDKTHMGHLDSIVLRSGTAQLYVPDGI